MKRGLMYLGVFVGGGLGGWLPTLWGESPFSLQSILGSTIGGFLGIWAGYKLTKLIIG